MNIHEYQGKAVLRKYGASTPRGFPCLTPDEAVDAAADVETNLGQLGGLARAGFAAHDDDLMRGDGLCDLLAPLADRQLGRKLRARRERAAPLDLGWRKSHQECGRGALATAYLRRSRRSA